MTETILSKAESCPTPPTTNTNARTHARARTHTGTLTQTLTHLRTYATQTDRAQPTETKSLTDCKGSRIALWTQCIPPEPAACMHALVQAHTLGLTTAPPMPSFLSTPPRQDGVACTFYVLARRTCPSKRCRVLSTPLVPLSTISAAVVVSVVGVDKSPSTRTWHARGRQASCRAAS